MKINNSNEKIEEFNLIINISYLIFRKSAMH